MREALSLAGLVCILAGSLAAAEESSEDLAKKLNNPVAALISVPLQLNYDENFGPNEDGKRWVLNIQPVMPISLNADWNVISRTILPVIDQKDIVPGTSQSGIGDITQSFFFAPVKPTASGWIWGAGPAFLLPTASDDLLGSEKWGLGPTIVFLKQQDGWTYGALVNHIWSVAGDDNRANISSTFLQPIISHTTKTAWTFSMNLESSYDWKAREWSAPINLSVSKLEKFGNQPVSFALGVRYWADSPTNGPKDFGARLVVTFLFPK